MSTQTTSTADTIEQNRAVATEFFTAVHARDLPRMQACWKPGSIDAFPGFRTMRVPEEQAEFFGAFFEAFRDWNMEILAITCEDDVAVVHWRLSVGFTGPGRFDGFLPTGAKGTVQGIDRLVVQDGKIVHLDAYLDTTEMARAIGLMPPAGSGADKGMKAMVNLQTKIKNRLKRS